MYIACNYSRKVTLNNNSGRYVTNMQIVIYIIIKNMVIHAFINKTRYISNDFIRGLNLLVLYIYSALLSSFSLSHAGKT